MIRNSLIASIVAAIVMATGAHVLAMGPGSSPSQGVGGNPLATPTVQPAPASTVAAEITPPYISLGVGYGQDGTLNAGFATSAPVGYLDYDAHPGPGILQIWEGTNASFPGPANNGGLGGGVFQAFSSVAHYQFGTPNESTMQKWPYYDKREQDFYHNGDAAFLTGTPSASGTCIWNWQPDLRPNAGKYQLVNGATGAVIATVTGTTFTESSLTNGTQVWRYLNTVFVDPTATTVNAAITASANPQTAVYTPTATTQVIRGDDWLSIGGAHPEIVRVLNQPSGGGAPGTTNDTSHFVAVFTQNHAIGDSISEIEPYDGTDPLDQTTSAYPNVTNTFGAPLGTGGRVMQGCVSSCGPFTFTLASCTPSASAPTTTATAILSKFNMTIANNPEPQTTEPTPAPTPASGSTISISGSIEETASASAQATPSVSYVYSASSFTPATPTQTWTSSSAGLSNNTLIWTINASTTLTTNVANGRSPIDIQVCVPGGQCTEWWNFQVGDRTFCTSYGSSNPTCYESNPNAYQRSLDNQDLFDDEIRSMLSNPTPPPGGLQGGFVGEELHDAFGGSGAAIDIQNSVDTLLPNDSDLFNGLLKYGQNMAAWFTAGGGTNAGCTVSGCGTWNLNWGAWDFQDENMIGNGNPYASSLKCTNCTYANASTNRTWRMSDECIMQASQSTANVAGSWVPCATNALLDGVQNPPITDFILDFGSNGTSLQQLDARYLIEANYFLIQHGAQSHGTVMKYTGEFDATNHLLADPFATEYVPMGFPLVDPAPISNPTAAPTTALGSIFNATDQLFERPYTNGIVLLCPQTGILSGACGTWHSPNGYTVWALNPDSATGTTTLLGGATVQARSYTAITSWTPGGSGGVSNGFASFALTGCTSPNCSAVIITYDPY